MKITQPLDTPKANKIIIPIKKRIFIHTSGGADSSLILYLTAKKIQGQSIPIDCFGLYVTKDLEKGINTVIDYVAKKFPNVQFNRLIQPFEDENNKANELWKQKLEIIDTFYKKELNLEKNDVSFLLGLTKAYEGLEYTNRDHANRQGKSWVGMSYLPFGNITKNEVREIYDELNLMDLFELTHSCIDMPFGEHCGKCYWCKERKLAFGKL